MKILATIVICVVILIAAVIFLASSICAVSSGVSGDVRAMAVVFAVVTLGVMIGGLFGIAAMYKSKEPPQGL